MDSSRLVVVHCISVQLQLGIISRAFREARPGHLDAEVLEGLGPPYNVNFGLRRSGKMGTGYFARDTRFAAILAFFPSSLEKLYVPYTAEDPAPYTKSLTKNTTHPKLGCCLGTEIKLP